MQPELIVNLHAGESQQQMPNGSDFRVMQPPFPKPTAKAHQAVVAIGEGLHFVPGTEDSSLEIR